MARTRLIYPTAPRDEAVASCSALARLVWAYLPCHADREGRLEDKPFSLRLEILPVDQVDMDALLGELAAVKLITRYEVDGRRFIQIRTFVAHQKPHKRETESRIPPPPTGVVEAEKRLALVGPGQTSASPRPTKVVASRAVSDPVPDPVPDPVRLPLEACAESARTPTPAPPIAVMDFPVDGKTRSWDLTQRHLEQFREAFPSLDVGGELRKARLYVTNNPAKRKTAGGMLRFLQAWLERVQNGGRSGGLAPPPSPPRGLCGFHAKPGTAGKKANYADLANCSECRHVSALENRRSGSTATAADLLPQWGEPPAAAKGA